MKKCSMKPSVSSPSFHVDLPDQYDLQKSNLAPSHSHISHAEIIPKLDFSFVEHLNTQHKSNSSRVFSTQHYTESDKLYGSDCSSDNYISDRSLKEKASLPSSSLYGSLFVAVKKEITLVEILAGEEEKSEGEIEFLEGESE